MKKDITLVYNKKMEGISTVEIPNGNFDIYKFMDNILTFDFNKFLEETKNNPDAKIYINLTLDASVANNPKFTRKLKGFINDILVKPESKKYDYMYYNDLGMYSHYIGINLVVAPELLTKEQQLRELQDEYDEICNQSKKWLETYKKLIAYQEEHMDYELSLDIKKLENILFDMVEQMDNIDKNIKNLTNN